MIEEETNGFEHQPESAGHNKRSGQKKHNGGGKKKKGRKRNVGINSHLGRFFDVYTLDAFDKAKLTQVQPRDDIKSDFHGIFKPLYTDENDDRKLDYYFGSYSTYHIHEEMLQDSVSFD